MQYTSGIGCTHKVLIFTVPVMIIMEFIVGNLVQVWQPRMLLGSHRRYGQHFQIVLIIKFGMYWYAPQSMLEPSKDVRLDTEMDWYN